MYIINEYQTVNGTTAIVPPVAKATHDLALQEFFSRCSYAAVSSVECHTIQMVRNDGFVERTECFRHDSSQEE